MENFKHFCLYERQRIEKYLKKKKSLRFIAGKLDRPVSSISYEIKTNSVNGYYDAKKAEAKAVEKRAKSKIQCLKVAMDEDLKKYVTEQIENDQSPEGISGRIKYEEKSLQYASTKAIYKFVKSPHGRQIEKHLYSKSVKKKGGPKRKLTVSEDGRTMIDERPKEIETRLEFGHFEGDFIESGKDGKGSLLVLVERKSRYPFLIYTEDKSTKYINRLIAETLKGVPVKSITLDNDLSFQKHKEMSLLVGVDVFFCHPMCPHEKGTVENRNKATRRYVPKRSNLSKYDISHFKFVENKLRGKFMKCLNYRTPKEVFDEEVKKDKTKIPQVECGIIEERLLLKKCSN
jgi:IS30 family transposase